MSYLMLRLGDGLRERCFMFVLLFLLFSLPPPNAHTVDSEKEHCLLIRVHVGFSLLSKNDNWAHPL